MAVLASLTFVAIVVAGVVFESQSGSWRSPPSPARFAGAAACGKCHRAEYDAWKTSQHSVAMQDATPTAVLGRFDGTRFTSDALTSTFFRRGDRYFVNTEGEDGARHDYEIRWTFGVYPLQQYLVELNGGRVQALTVAWDARPSSEGGQRWFTLTPGHGSGPQDALHWTGRRYNWNYTCADCHSTAVRKGYDATASAFRTVFEEKNVACEACHGPGAEHAARARYPGWLRRVIWRDDGLAARLTERQGVTWKVDSASRLPYRSAPRRTDREIETCAQCHARRVHIADGYVAGAPLLDYYIPALMEVGLYYPDGQQRDEVYDYGSFLQSRMYAAGVTCSDCHEPHGAKLRRPGNQVCTQCHLASAYDAPAHHHHVATSAGSQCVNCHMPTTTYMQIDARHDHSIRIPRPDLTVTLGVPNACQSCHRVGDARWFAAQIRAWYPKPAPGFQRFANEFAADDRHDPSATGSLGRVSADSTQPWFVRASALGRLADHPGNIAITAARTWLHDGRPLLRLAALQIIENYGVTQRLTLALPLLTDTTRAVRQGAAWLIAPFTDSLHTVEERRAFDVAAAEFVASQRYNADQPSSRMALGAYFAQRGQLDSAEAEFSAAVRLDPHFTRAADALAAVQRARKARAPAPKPPT